MRRFARQPAGVAVAARRHGLASAWHRAATWATVTWLAGCAEATEVTSAAGEEAGAWLRAGAVAAGLADEETATSSAPMTAPAVAPAPRGHAAAPRAGQGAAPADSATPVPFAAPAVAVPWLPAAIDSAVRRGTEPAADEPLAVTLGRLRQLASVGEVRQLPERLSAQTLARLGERQRQLVPIAPRRLQQRLEGDVVALRFHGGRALVDLSARGRVQTLAFYLEGGRWRWDLLAEVQPLADGPWLAGAPAGGPGALPQLREAVAGIRGVGPLVAVFETSLGTFRCELDEVRARHSVALFAALARGRVPALVADGDGPRVWRALAYFDGTLLHPVEGEEIAGGARGGEGGRPAERDSGLRVDDELRLDEAFADRGALVLDNDGPGTASGRFRVALRPRPAWRDRFTRIGTCRDLDVLGRVARAGQPTRLVALELQRGF